MQTAEAVTAPNPILIDVVEVGQLLNCSPRHVYRMSDAGKMPPARRLGTLVRWVRGELETWIAGGCKPVQT
jgi:excisionase family DNA binding protein